MKPPTQLTYDIYEKSAQRRRKHCAQAVVRRSQKVFTLPPTPFPGVRDGQNLISWRWALPLPISLVNRPTHTPTPTPPQTGPITIHCAAASVQCNNGFIPFCQSVLILPDISLIIWYIVIKAV